MEDDEITPVPTHEEEEEEDDEVKPEELPRSVRGAPEHMKAAIRKKQNSESAKRSRARRKEGYRKLFEKFHEQTRQIAALEERVSTLISILDGAGIAIPPNMEDSVCENINAARAAEREAAGRSAAQDDSPDDEQLFKEMMRILEGGDEE